MIDTFSSYTDNDDTYHRLPLHTKNLMNVKSAMKKSEKLYF